MKKSFLSLALVLALCLSLAVPAFATEAKAGDTTVTDANGVTYRLSNPIIRIEPNWNGTDKTMYIVPEGTSVIPISAEGYQIEEDDGFVVFRKTNTEYITIWSASLGMGLGGSSLEGIVVNRGDYEDAGVPYPPGYVSNLWRDDRSTEASVYFLWEESTVGNFTDVKPGDWFYEPVQWAVKEGVTNGTSLTTFSPNQDCTVAHILTFLWRANGSPKAEGDNPFSDVKADDWFYGAALWAKEKGMVTGDTFNPNTLCTRSMAVKYLWQAAGSPSAKASNFSDVPAGADYAQAVNWAVEKGITNGTSLTTFSPSEVCTRGHIVTFLYRDLAK